MQESLTLSLVRFHPESAATYLEALSTNEAAQELSDWPADVAGKVLGHMLPHRAATLLIALTTEQRSMALQRMRPHAAAQVIQQLDAAQQESVLSEIHEGLAATIRTMSTWAEHTAGGMMDTRVATLRDHFTVEQSYRDDSSERHPIASTIYTW